jgi:hypothetical protein
MSPLNSDTFDSDALDYLEMVARRSRLAPIVPLSGDREDIAVLAWDGGDTQRRWRYIRGSYLRESVERAVAVHDHGDGKG